MKARRSKMALALLVAFPLAACGGSAGGDNSSSNDGEFNAEEFFAGKTIRVVATHSAGGGTDIFARFVAPKLAEAIPGKPRITVTNEEGLGGAGTIFDAGEDDLVLGVTSQASTTYTLVLDPANTIDPTKVQVIGGVGGDPRGLIMHTDVADAYGDDWTAANGSSGPSFKWAQVIGSPTDIVSDSYMASWLCSSLDWPCEMASVASDDSQDLALMVKRGELNAVIGTEIGLLRDYTAELDAGQSKIAFTFAPDPATTLEPPSYVTATDITDGLTPELVEEFERIYPAITTGGLGRHFWAGPDMGKEVLEVLRTAYTKALSDPATVEEMARALAGGGDGAKVTYSVSPVDGADAQQKFDENAQKFVDNLDYYTEKQKEYYDRYWK